MKLKFKDILRNKKGSSLMAGLIVVFLLAAIGVSVSYITSSNQRSRIQQASSDQASYFAFAGIEFALAKIIVESSTSTTFDPKFGGETISVARVSGRITAIGTKNDAVSQYSVADPNPFSSTECLVVDTSTAYVASSQTVAGIILRRNPTCTDAISIESMSGTTWLPNNLELLQSISIEGTAKFTGPATGSGGSFGFTSPYVLNDSSNHALSMFWNFDIDYHDFKLYFNYKYNDIDYVTVADLSFLAENQADCFDWVTATARLEKVVTYSRMIGSTLVNSCPEPIRLDKLQITWTPDLPTRMLNQVKIHRVDLFSGAVGNGALIEVDDLYTGSTTYEIDRFQFDDDMLGRNYTINWLFADGTSKSVDLILFAPNQANCMQINTAMAGIDSGNTKNISGLSYQNTCDLDIAIKAITVSWTGGDPAMRFATAVKIYGTDGPINLSPDVESGEIYYLGSNSIYSKNGDGLMIIEKLSFNKSLVAGTVFTLSFTMYDDTVKSETFTVY